jgi:hypothetical protein
VEENAYWANEERGWEFLYGRQERLHIIGDKFSSLAAYSEAGADTPDDKRFRVQNINAVL